MITKEALEKEKLSLHLRYISGISFACICLVIILHCCQSTMFQNCISVSSTVTSIILSVVAIILSVTGERTTNEIRNKVTDSVEQLEDCTEKSSMLTEELTKTLQQMNDLYDNVNEKVSDIPKIKTALNDLVSQNKGNNCDIKTTEEDVNVIEHVACFLNNMDKNTEGIKHYTKETYSFVINECKKRAVSTDELIQRMISMGADNTIATLVIGIIMGNLSTGMIGGNIEELIEKL